MSRDWLPLLVLLKYFSLIFGIFVVGCNESLKSLSPLESLKTMNNLRQKACLCGVGPVAPACNPRIQETDIGRSLEVQGQSGLQSELQASLSYRQEFV